MERSKNRLELRNGLQGCTPFFFVSISCGHPILEVTKDSDKMQTKTAQKRDPGLASQVSKSLYNGGVSTSIAKVVISLEKSKGQSICQGGHAAPLPLL
jgi:hypothetical protein